MTSPATAAPASMRTVELIGNKVLQTLGPLRVNVSSCFVPFASQHAFLTQDGLLRMTFSAYESRRASVAMFSSHSLCARSASWARFTTDGGVNGVSQFTSF